MANVNKVRDDSLKYYSMVARLVHYTSKFALNDDVRSSKQYSTTRNRLPSNIDSTDKPTETRRFRLAPIWPEWNETEINNETWDNGIIKKKDTGSARSRADAKTNIAVVPPNFEDPEGKIELPPSLKVEQWKRPIDFLPSDKPPVVVDPDLGIQNFDLITSNEHLHYSEIMRNIISQITILWDICRKERKTTNTNPENITQTNTSERAWRPWEHIYALNKVSKQAFITPYNPAGKYVVRLFFLGTWRKIIIDDSIPFDSQNRCLLPQTTLSYELWPMLLTKALLKVITLDSNALGDLSEYSEASIIHLLTGWIPEPIPLKYTYAEKIWYFLRYGHPDKHALENELLSTSSLGPVPLYKWPNPNEEMPISRKNKRHSSKKASASFNPSILKSASRSFVLDDQSISEESKVIIFATISHSQSARHSSYSETADRSERLRCYNLNETFSTSVLVTSIRDIQLEPPAPPQPSEIIPAWKLIRPRQPKTIPHAEPIVPHEKKIERWIEIASSYISYPTTSVLNMMVATPTARARRSAKHSASPSPGNITEVDEDEDIERGKLKLQLNYDLLRSTTSISLPTTKKELNVVESQEKFDESTRTTGSKSKRETPIDKTKPLRKSAVVTTKVSSETLSTKSKGVESEPIVTSIDVPTITNNNEQQNSPSTSSNSSKKPNPLPKIWMDFNDFCACFTSIIVFHNPRAYQFNHKHTEIKFTPYQPVLSSTIKDKKKESIQPVAQPIPNLQDDKSSLYLFVDSTRETLDKNIELIISLTCLPRWYDSSLNETVVHARGTAEKSPINPNLTRIIVSQKEIIAQMGSLIAEIYSWKSLSIGQPILRLHTTATKAALLTLPPGRHVLKLTNACPFAFNLNVLSNTNDFLLGDEDQLLNKISSVPEDAECLIQAEELFLAFEESIENFHLINQQENKLYEFFRSVCQNAPQSLNLAIQTCLHAFHQALYSTLRTVIGASGSTINAETQFAWRCFTNDLATPDILGAFEIKRTSKRFSKEELVLSVTSPGATSANRHSTRTDGRSSAGTSKRTGGNRERSSEDKTKPSSVVHSSSISDVQEDFLSDWLNREMNIDEIDAIINIQKIARGFLQRRIDLARKAGTQKNLFIQQALKSTLSLLKADFNKSAILLFKNFISAKPQLIQCFSFRNDDWNMVNYRDYSGMYQEQSANTWFILFRDIFHITEDGLIAAKLLSHFPNSLLRVINNDTYEEMSLVFNRLAPGMFTKNKNGYTFFAEGMSHDLPTPTGRFRLRLITSYTNLPEPRIEQITSTFITKEMMDYYLPNKDEIICRYRVIVADDTNQTGRNFHLASIHFSTSKSDVFMRLTILDNDDEIVSVEGKGTVILPAILFMRPVSNVSQPPSRPPSKTSHKKSVSSTHQGSVVDSTVMSKERIGSGGKRSGSSSRTELSSADVDEKPHKYFIQVTLLRKSWPLTLTQWQFIEQEKYELRALNRQSSQAKSERRSSSSTGGKRGSQPNVTIGKGRSGSVKNRLNVGGKTTIDTTKPHWTLRVISDADKAEELTIKKDNERIEELLNMKKAWETLQTGRAEKAMQTRQRFLDSLQPKSDEQSTPEISDVIISLSDTHTDTEISFSSVPSSNEQVAKQASSRKRSTSKKGSIKDIEALKQTELTPPQLQIDEPLFNEPPPSLKPKISLPTLDLQPFIRRKLSLNESILFTSFTEHEQFKYRRNAFNEYLNSLDVIRQHREDDQNYRSDEKTRQLEEYVDLQGRIDQIRRCINEPREAFRQRFLEVERQRLELIAAEQQRLLEEERAKAAAMIKPVEKKPSVGKKKKK